MLVISPTKFNGEWTSIVGDDHVREAWDEPEIEKILEQQKSCREKGKPNPPGLQILDDCLGLRKQQLSPPDSVSIKASKKKPTPRPKDNKPVVSVPFRSNPSLTLVSLLRAASV